MSYNQHFNVCLILNFLAKINKFSLTKNRAAKIFIFTFKKWMFNIAIITFYFLPIYTYIHYRHCNLLILISFFFSAAAINLKNISLFFGTFINACRYVCACIRGNFACYILYTHLISQKYFCVLEVKIFGISNVWKKEENIHYSTTVINQGVQIYWCSMGYLRFSWKILRVRL